MSITRNDHSTLLLLFAVIPAYRFSNLEYPHAEGFMRYLFLPVSLYHMDQCWRGCFLGLSGVNFPTNIVGLYIHTIFIQVCLSAITHITSVPFFRRFWLYTHFRGFVHRSRFCYGCTSWRIYSVFRLPPRCFMAHVVVEFLRIRSTIILLCVTLACYLKL